MPVINKEIDIKSFNHLIETSQTANVFQTLAMYKFWEGLDNHEPFIYSAFDNDGDLSVVLSGVILKEGNSIKGKLTKRAIIFGGPLLSQKAGTADALLEVLNEVENDLKSKAIYIETRNLVDFSVYRNIFEKAGWQYKPHLNFHVDCTDEAIMRKNMSKSKMRQIKKSLKTGAEIIVADNLEHIKSFYEILDNLYKTKVKTPLPDFSFFKRFFESGIGKYLLIRYESKIIGGIMCPILKDKVIYEWYVCGIDGEINDIYPSILATWAAMDYANKNNIPRFDFMGAGSPDKDYGVREFKSKFGGEQVEHGRFFKVFNPLLYNVGKTGVKILKSIK